MRNYTSDITIEQFEIIREDLEKLISMISSVKYCISLLQGLNGVIYLVIIQIGKRSITLLQ